MRVLFAVSTDSIARSIINKYQVMYKQILSAKSVYYFDAIVKELQRDKTYDRVVISEDLEPHTDNNYERIDNNIFNKLDRITDEASNVLEGEIPIIIIGADRRTKADPLLTKLFGIGIYNVLLGQDRSLEDVCTLINKPRSKKEAKLYYNISDVSNVTYAPEAEDTVPEEQIQNILNHFNKVGKNEPVIISSFNSIADQYSSEQLKIIIKHLPLQVRAVLETSSDRYKEFVTSEQGQKNKMPEPEEGKAKRKGFFSRPSKAKNKTKYVPNQETVINNNYVPNAVQNNIEVIPIEPINSALNNNENMGNVIIPKSVDINNAHSAPSYSTDNNGIMFTETNNQNNPQENITTNNNVAEQVQETPASTPVQEVQPETTPEDNMTMPGLFDEAEETPASTPVQEVQPEAAPEDNMTMPGLFDEVEETPASEPVQEVKPETTPEDNMTMPGLFDEVEEVPASTPVQEVQPETTPEDNMTMPGLFDEVEEVPASTPVQEVQPEVTPEDNMTMPGLFDEVEEVPASTPVQEVQPETTPEDNMAMPGLFDEVEEVPASEPVQEVQPEVTLEDNMAMPGLFDEVEEVPASEPVQEVQPEVTPEDNMAMPGLFDEVEETQSGESVQEVKPEVTPQNQNNTVVEETAAPRRGRGRPRKYPKVEIDPNAPKRGRGRPRKAVSLGIGVEGAGNTVISETVTLAENAEFQIKKPETILKESISQSLSSKYAIDNFAVNNTMPQMDMFNISNNEDTTETETASEGVVEDKNESISETIPGLFDDIETTEGNDIADDVEIEIPNNDNIPEVSNEVVEETTETTINVPENNNIVEETPEPVQEVKPEVTPEDNTAMPGLFDEIEEPLNDTNTSENLGEDELPSLLDNIDTIEETPSAPENNNAEEDELPGLFDNIDSMEEPEPVVEETPAAPENNNAEDDELPGLFDNIDSMEEPEPVVEETTSAPENNNTEEDELPGLFDNIDSMEEPEPTVEEMPSAPENNNTEDDELPGLFDNIDSMEGPELAVEEAPAEPVNNTDNDELPNLLDSVENMDNTSAPNAVNQENQEEDLPGLISNSEELDNAFGGVKQQTVDNKQAIDISSALNGTNKLVAFVGTQKNGTSFVVNNLATLISQNNVDVAILDLTRNKDSYYVFTNNDQELMKKGKKCIEKLVEGFYEGIQVQNNLTIYTSLPGEEEKFENAQVILSNLLKKYSLVILDCDFDTIPDYFKASQEIYLVQTYDILTIQPLTKFLRDSLEKGIISVDKLRIVINKELRMKKLTRSLLIGGISTYNDPGLDYMKELFDPNMIMATSIPFDVDTYETYLENMVDCKISLRGYSNEFKQALAVLANMVYPLSTSRMQNNSQRITRQGDSNQNNFNKMNDTLSKMRNNF